MALVKTAVLLYAHTGTGPLNLQHERIWYDHYFFHPSSGQCGYWIKQTDGERVLHGQVFDWLFDAGPLPNFASRNAMANYVIKAYEQAKDVDFGSFDVVVVVIGVGKATATDGGSTTAASYNRTHNAVVIRIGDPFDFVAHELGHALGLKHSFGANPVPIVGDAPGGYGHPFCIMSARFYGGAAPAYTPPAPQITEREYRSRGPGLNGLTARANGWIDAHVMNLAATAEADFTIRARQWLGRTQYAPPQGVEIVAADGSNWVVDYYEPMGWDLGQPSPAAVLTQGRGGRAQTHYPTANSGTYIAQARIPVTFGAAGSTLPAAAFRVHLLEYNKTSRELRVRVKRGAGTSPKVVIDSRVDTLSTRTEANGTTTWADGEALCISGSWDYDLVGRSQEAVIEATYELGAPGMTALWSIEGRPLPATAAPLNGLTHKLELTVRVAHPKFQKQDELREITLQCDIEPLANGSRLKVRNRPQDETFKLRIEVTLSNSVGSGSELTWVDFTGREYDYGDAFDQARDACLQTFIDIGERYRPYKVVLLPELWERIDRIAQPRVNQWLEALADRYERGDMAMYEQGAQALAQEIGVPDLQLRVLSVEEAFSPPRLDREIAPPAPAELTAALAPGRGSSGRAAGRLIGGLLFAGAGAMLAYLVGRRRA